MADTPLKSPSKRLGTILVEEGVISEGQLKEALKAQEEQGGFLGKVLLDMSFIKENVLIELLVKQCKIPHISLLDYQVNEKMFTYVPTDVCLEHGLLPIDKLGRILTVAMTDPLDIVALEKVRSLCPELRIKPILCSWNHYEIVMRKLLPGNEGPKTSEPVEHDFGLVIPKGKPKPKAKEAAVPNAAGGGIDEVQQAVDRLRIERETDEGAPGVQDFIEMIHESVRKSILVEVDNLQEKVQRTMALSREGKLPISSMELIQTVQKAYSESLDEAVASLLYRTQQALNQAKSKAVDLSVQDLADVLRVCMRDAIRDSMGTMVREFVKNRPEEG